ncbi:MAG: hypothetical protein IJU30_08535 [Lachnospiraceae bacterium]|nr:hypothetical protein [Lachnospiraceae bacterium]
MIIFTILKWIGIILLIVLGLILLALLIVLFVPVRYRISGSFLSDIPDGSASASWLLGAVRGGAEYHRPEKAGDRPAGVSAFVKVLWITLFEIPEKQEEPETPSESKTEDTSTDGQALSEDAVQPVQEPVLVQANEEPKEIKPEIHAAAVESENVPETAALSETEEPAGRFERFTSRISAWWKDVSSTVKALYRSIKKRTDGIEKIKDMITAESNRKEMDLVKRGLLRILKELAPRKGSGRIELGTGDPYSTGQIMQIFAMLYPLYGDSVEVIPEFVESVHDAEGDISGAVRMFPIVWSVLRCILSKRLRAIFKKSKKILDQEILA